MASLKKFNIDCLCVKEDANKCDLKWNQLNSDQKRCNVFLTKGVTEHKRSCKVCHKACNYSRVDDVKSQILMALCTNNDINCVTHEKQLKANGKHFKKVVKAQKIESSNWKSDKNIKAFAMQFWKVSFCVSKFWGTTRMVEFVVKIPNRQNDRTTYRRFSFRFDENFRFSLFGASAFVDAMRFRGF